VSAQVTAQMPPDGPARLSLRRHGGAIVTRSMAEAMALANAAAPEHMVVDDEAMAAQVKCVGSLFVGGWSAQVAGDYAIGSNHVLPTAGAARVRGGLSAADFVRQITVQRVTRAGLSRIGRSVIDLARAEGLNAHAESIVVRLGDSAGRKSTAGPKNRTRPTQSRS
jgi:histidinol dehydrogenase